MWRYSIVVPKKYGQVVYRLKDLLKNKIKDLTHVQTVIEQEDTYAYYLVLPLDRKMEFKPYILNYLVDNILYFYKKEYLLKNINFKVKDDIKVQSFLKALLCFDYSLDREIIFEKIKESDSVYLESLYSFGLKQLLPKWKDLVNLANDNFFYFQNENSFLQLLKFLVSNIEYKTNVVNVYFDDKYVFYDQNNNLINDYLLDFPTDTDSYLISSLICLCPQQIKLHFNSQNISDGYLLFDLFDDRIEII